MKEKLLRLCRRLNKFTLDDLLSFINDEKEVVSDILKLLISEGKVIYNNNHFYTIDDKPTQLTIDKRQNKNLKLMLNHHSIEQIELICRCFCTEIPAYKVAYLTSLSSSCINDFYNVFKRMIHEEQTKKLSKYYLEKPQMCRFRMFFGRKIYFYIYDSQVFAVEKPIVGYNEKPYTKNEVREFKKIYSYLSRIECHHKNSCKLMHNISESLWRNKKDFLILFKELKKLIEC